MSETSTAISCGAEIVTSQAKRYMIQLCKHFQHKRPVMLEDQSGHISFTLGDCRLRANDGALILSLEAADDAQMLQLQDVVARHLLRVAFREAIQITWHAA